MPTEKELRKAMAARANRKALEEAREAHDKSVRESFEDYYRKEKEALRQKEAQQRYAEKVRRNQEEQAARPAKRTRAERTQTAPENAEWRMIASKVVQRVRGVTLAEVLREMAKLQAKGRSPNDWTSYMVWWMRNGPNRPNSGPRGAPNKPDK